MSVYYVAPTGNNSNNGTQNSPFATLQKAHDVAVAGDTIYMRGGTYKPTKITTLTRDGTSGKPITVTNYQNEKPVLDGSAMPAGSYSYVVKLSSASWWHLKGLEICKGAEGGLYIDGASNNNTFENLNVHHCGWDSEWEGKGVVMFGSGANNLFLNIDSHHNEDKNLDNADGFQIACSGAGNIFRGCRAWANSDDGWDLFNVQAGGTNAGSLTLDNCWAFGNGYRENGANAGDGMGFKLGGMRQGEAGTSGPHILKNCLAWGNRQHGFDENEASKKQTLDNCTASNNLTYNYAFWGNKGHIFRKNIAHGTGKTAITGTATDNSWQGGRAVSDADFLSLDDTKAKGARGADGSLPVSDFLRLREGSDLEGLGAFPVPGNGTTTPPVEPPVEPTEPPLDVTVEFAALEEAVEDTVAATAALKSKLGL